MSVEHGLWGFDAGAGQGNSIVNACDVPTGQRTVLVDMSAGDLMRNVHWGQNAAKVVADIAALPFRDRSFGGLSVSCHSLEHTPEPVKTFSEFVRVMAPGGRIVVATPDPKFDGVVARLVGRALYYSRHMHQSVISREKLGALASKNELLIEKLKPNRVHAAIVITLMAVAEKLKLGVEFIDQAGFKETNRYSKLIFAALWRGFRFLENHTLLRLLNSVYPFENILIAQKQSYRETGES